LPFFRATPVDVKVEGAEKFGKLAKALRDAGRTDLQRELYSGINRAVKPLTVGLKGSTARFLPARYAAVLSKSLRVKTRQRPRGASGPGVYLVGSAKTKGGKDRDLSSLNRGRLRHPLFGDRRHWFDQQVSPNWWDDPLLEGADEIRKEIVKSLDDVARKLDKKY